MFSKISKVFGKKKTWERVFALQESASEGVAWESLHFAVNPQGLIENTSWRPPVRFFEYCARHSLTEKWQWIGSKDTKKSKLETSEGHFDLEDKRAISDMLNWNALSGSLILEGLRTLSAPFASSPNEEASLNKSDEDRALEWMRVSFDLLKKAITNCPNEFNPSRDQTLFSQSLLFWHEHSEGQSLPRMRLIAFNLDITLHPYPIALENQELWALGVVVYNHKDSVSEEPALSSTFIYQPRAALDLVASILETSKQHFYWPL